MSGSGARQHDEVDPDNRLVAAELEQRWCACRRAVRTIEDERDGLVANTEAALTQIERDCLLALGNDRARRQEFRFVALPESSQNAFGALGRAPLPHRNDSLSATFGNLHDNTRQDQTHLYKALCAHYGIEPTRNTHRFTFTTATGLGCICFI
jgi:hypothetical protein